MHAACLLRHVCSCVVLMLATGCGGFYSCDFRHVDEIAYDSIASELREGSSVSPSDLRIATNIRGEGLIIVAQSQTARQESLTAWLFLSGKSYAINSTARELTPRLPLVSDAPTEALSASGLNMPIERGVRDVLARTALREPRE